MRQTCPEVRCWHQGVFLRYFSTTCFETGSLSEPGACHASEMTWPMSLGAWPASAPQFWGYRHMLPRWLFTWFLKIRSNFAHCVIPQSPCALLIFIKMRLIKPSEQSYPSGTSALPLGPASPLFHFYLFSGDRNGKITGGGPHP